MMNIARVENGTLNVYMREIGQYPLLSREEEHRLAVKYRASGDREAAMRLVTSNLRFVVKIAYEYTRYGMKLADLIQEGNMGLMKAVQKFDPSRGYRLISYAVWWIRAFIQAFILKSWSMVKIGTTQAQRRLFFSLEKAKREVARLEGGDAGTKELPEPGKISDRLNVTSDEINDMERRIHGRDLSIDSPISDDSSETYLDQTADPRSDFQEEIIRKEDGAKLQISINKALDELPVRERYIIENRAMADEPKTLEEIGKAFGITRERTRQLEYRALSRLRERMAEFQPAW